MAKFIFKLENILSIKYKLEDQAKAEYSIEVHKLREEQEKLDALRNKMVMFENKLTEAVKDKLDLFNIKSLEDAVENIKYNIRLQLVVVINQEINTEKARNKLDDAMKERKIYEKLKEKAFEKFKEEVNEQEQKEINELVSFRFRSAEESED